MVNRIDGHARRRELAEAVWRITGRDGLAAASVRSVAAETGLSAGSVRHFFGTQHELIAFAMHELIDAVADRISAAARIEEPHERVLAVLSELVPLTERTRAEAAAHLEFVAAARADPELALLAEQTFERIRAVCRQVIVWLRDLGRLADDVDVQRAGVTLAAVVDGVTMQLLFAPRLLTPEAAREVIEQFVLHAAAGYRTGAPATPH